jgi:hypothetical protein
MRGILCRPLYPADKTTRVERRVFDGGSGPDREAVAAEMGEVWGPEGLSSGLYLMALWLRRYAHTLPRIRWIPGSFIHVVELCRPDVYWLVIIFGGLQWWLFMEQQLRFQTHISDNLFGAVGGFIIEKSYGKWRKSGK